jgi:hypothetical protein
MGRYIDIARLFWDENVGITWTTNCGACESRPFKALAPAAEDLAAHLRKCDACRQAAARAGPVK